MLWSIDDHRSSFQDLERKTILFVFIFPVKGFIKGGLYLGVYYCLLSLHYLLQTGLDNF